MGLQKRWEQGIPQWCWTSFNPDVTHAGALALMLIWSWNITMGIYNHSSTFRSSTETRQRRFSRCASHPPPAVPFCVWNASSIHGAELSLIDLSVAVKRRTQNHNAILSPLLTLPPPPTLNTYERAWVMLRRSSGGIKNRRTLECTTFNSHATFQVNQNNK